MQLAVAAGMGRQAAVNAGRGPTRVMRRALARSGRCVPRAECECPAAPAHSAQQGLNVRRCFTFKEHHTCAQDTKALLRRGQPAIMPWRSLLAPPVLSPPRWPAAPA